MIAAFAAGLLEVACTLLCVALGALFVVATTIAAVVAAIVMVADMVRWWIVRG